MAGLQLSGLGALEKALIGQLSECWSTQKWEGTVAV